MKRTELYVGIFIAFGLFCFGYVALSLGGLRVFGDNRYTLYADFVSTSGLKPGAVVEIAGVQIGNITEISLKDNKARLTLKLTPGTKIPVDSSAAIRTRGLIGEKFVKITPGAEDQILTPGQEIDQTDSVVDLEELIGKLMFDKKDESKANGAKSTRKP